MLIKFFFQNCKEYGFERTEIAPNVDGIYYENKANVFNRRKNDILAVK